MRKPWGDKSQTCHGVLFEYMPAFPLSHACIVTDLTPIVTIDRRVRLPLSQGRRQGDDFFSRLMGAVEFPSQWIV